LLNQKKMPEYEKPLLSDEEFLGRYATRVLAKEKEVERPPPSRERSKEREERGGREERPSGPAPAPAPLPSRDSIREAKVDIAVVPPSTKERALPPPAQVPTTAERITIVASSSSGDARSVSTARSDRVETGTAKPIPKLYVDIYIYIVLIDMSGAAC